MADNLLSEDAEMDSRAFRKCNKDGDSDESCDNGDGDAHRPKGTFSVDKKAITGESGTRSR